MGYSKRVVDIGGVKIGGDNLIAIQSMTNTKTDNTEETVEQIRRLETAGCDIIRVAVPDIKAAEAIGEIKEAIHIPLVCDIHFDYKLALLSMDNGADKIRINPGNIKSEEHIREIVYHAQKYDIPIRVGVNSGSLRSEQIKKYGGVTSEGLFESAMYEVNLLEKLGFENIVISIKASDVGMCERAYELFAKERDYPLHLGITEAGDEFLGSIKSAVGLTQMLNKKIGDTIRVSLSADPVKEIYAARTILESLGLRKPKAQVVSCPTCGRTNIDLIPLAQRVTQFAMEIDKEIKIAVMGCAVNGPGEAKEADIGIAGGNGEGLLFSKGKIIRKVPESQLFNVLKEEIDKL